MRQRRKKTRERRRKKIKKKKNEGCKDEIQRRKAERVNEVKERIIVDFGEEADSGKEK